MLAGLVVALVGVGGVAGAEQAHPLVGAHLTLDGVAGVAPGMTPVQVRGAWGIPIVVGASKKGSKCRMARVASGPVRGYALFEKGRLSAVFFTAGMRTDRGIGVGSTTEALTMAYGAAKLLFVPARNSRSAIHVYTRARYLGDKRALRFDLDPQVNRVVTQIGMGSIDGGLAVSAGRC